MLTDIWRYFTQMGQDFDLLYYVGENFVAIFLIAGLLMIFRKNARIDLRKRNAVLWTIACVAVLIVTEVFETYCALYPSMKTFRLIASVIGYWLRPTVAIGVLSLIADLSKKQYVFIWIPAIINYFVFFTAFFSKLTFWFDENYYFKRGPLGYTVFVVSFFYIGLIVFETVRKFKNGQRWQGGIVLVCAVACVLAPLLEATNHAHYILYPTMLIAMLIYYFYIYAENLTRDQLTGLWKREIFFRDSKRITPRISAIVAIDMNGLKAINDARGHKFGDEALSSVAKVIRNEENDLIWAYRLGGDEFAILCLDSSEERVLDLIATIKEKVVEEGYSVSIGYAMREKAVDIDAVLAAADMRMYEDKDQYYSENSLS